MEPKTTLNFLNGALMDMQEALDRLRTVNETPDRSRPLSLAITELETACWRLGEARDLQQAKEQQK